MLNWKRYGTGLLCLILAMGSCKVPAITQHTENRSVPDTFANPGDTVSAATMQWKQFFTDPFLKQLIDTALKTTRS